MTLKYTAHWLLLMSGHFSVVSEVIHNHLLKWHIACYETELTFMHVVYSSCFGHSVKFLRVPLVPNSAMKIRTLRPFCPQVPRSVFRCQCVWSSRGWVCALLNKKKKRRKRCKLFMDVANPLQEDFSQKRSYTNTFPKEGMLRFVML